MYCIHCVYTTFVVGGNIIRRKKHIFMSLALTLRVYIEQRAFALHTRQRMKHIVIIKQYSVIQLCNTTEYTLQKNNIKASFILDE